MAAANRFPALRRIEDSASILVLTGMVLLPLAEVVGRTFIGRGIPNSIPLVQHLTLWVAFMGAAMAARSDRLLAVSLIDFLPESIRSRFRILTYGVAAGITAWMILACFELIGSQRGAGYEVAWGIPLWVALCILPLGLAFVALRLIRLAAPDWRGRAGAACGLIIPIFFLAFPGLQGSGLVLPAAMLIAVAALLGMPIFAVIGGLALLFFWNEGIPLAAVPDEAYRLTASPLLPAVPLFTLGGYILSEGGSSKRVLRLFTTLFGWMPGGLAIVVTLVLAFFTPLTGASGVTILSMGGLLFPVLVSARYPEKMSIGLVTVAGSIGLLLPPSLPVILYGVTSHINILHLFAAGLIPGLILILVVCGWGVVKGTRSKVTRTPFHGREALEAIGEAKWEVAMPIIVLTAIFGGFTTLVEAAALTVLYAVIVQCFVHRDLGPADELPRIAIESATLTGGFLVILGMALGLTGYMVDAEIPMRALDLVSEHIESRWAFLLALNVFLIIVGGLMDIYSAIFVVVPLIMPMGAAYGVDPIHLGIIFLANLELGYLTPPMGENLFLSAYRFKRSLPDLFRSTIPYWIILFATVLLITYCPPLTLGLLRLLGWAE
jgi:tripartite ATP-independent transporter DctM subunit